MGAEAEWSASYRKVAEIAVASSRARWFAVEAKATLRPATLAEVEVDDQAAGRRLIARLETWVDPAAVPIIGGGVSGDRAWLVYADPMSDPHDVVDPMGSQDVVTLGLELTAVVQRARAVGLSAPPMDPRLVVHDFLSDGTFRPRILGVGTPGPAEDERQLAAEIGQALYGALLGGDARTLGWTPGQAPPLSFREARGGRVPAELEQTIIKAMTLGYHSLDGLRADLSSTALTRSRTAARVGVVTDRYSTRDRITEGAVVATVPIPAPAPTAAPDPRRRRARWPWLALLALAGTAVALWVIPQLGHDQRPAPITSPTTAPILAATTPREPVPEAGSTAGADTRTAVDTTPIEAETAAATDTAADTSAAPDASGADTAGAAVDSGPGRADTAPPDGSPVAAAEPPDALTTDTLATTLTPDAPGAPARRPRPPVRPRPPAPPKPAPSNGPSDIILDR